MTNKEKEREYGKKKQRTTKATGKQRTKLQLVHNGQQLL